MVNYRGVGGFCRVVQDLGLGGVVLRSLRLLGFNVWVFGFRAEGLQDVA